MKKAGKGTKKIPKVTVTEDRRRLTSGDQCKDGMRVRVFCDGCFSVEGVLRVEKTNNEEKPFVTLLHNDPRLDGADPMDSDKRGFMYSWRLQSTRSRRWIASGHVGPVREVYAIDEIKPEEAKSAATKQLKEQKATLSAKPESVPCHQGYSWDGALLTPGGVKLSGVEYSIGGLKEHIAQRQAEIDRYVRALSRWKVLNKRGWQ